MPAKRKRNESSSKSPPAKRRKKNNEKAKDQNVVTTRSKKRNKNKQKQQKNKVTKKSSKKKQNTDQSDEPQENDAKILSKQIAASSNLEFTKITAKLKEKKKQKENNKTKTKKRKTKATNNDVVDLDNQSIQIYDEEHENNDNFVDNININVNSKNDKINYRSKTKQELKEYFKKNKNISNKASRLINISTRFQLICKIKQEIKQNHVEYLVQGDQSKGFRILQIYYQNRDIKETHAQCFADISIAVAKCQQIIFSEQPFEVKSKNPRPKQGTNLQFKITKFSDFETHFEEGQMDTAKVDVFNLFDLNQERIVYKPGTNISVYCFMLKWKQIKDLFLGYCHVLNEKNEIIESMTLCSKKIICKHLMPEQHPFIMLNAEISFYNGRFAVWFSGAKIINISDCGIFHQFFKCTLKNKNMYMNTGLINAVSNENHPEYNKRHLIKDLSPNTLNSLQQEVVYRIQNVRIMDCSRNPIGKHCPVHNTRLSEEELQNGVCTIADPDIHDLEQGGEWRFIYRTKLYLLFLFFCHIMFFFFFSFFLILVFLQCYNTRFTK